MLLNPADLAPYAKGVLGWQIGGNGGLIPQRFCAAQREVYRPYGDRTVRTQGASGVRFVFDTDATAFSMRAKVFPGSGQPWFGFDLVVDGQLWGHTEGDVRQQTAVDWQESLSGGRKQLCVYLSCLTGVEVLEVTLEGATVCQPVEYRERILVMGDSITQGYTSHFPSLTYVAQVAAARNADFLNQAIGGEVFFPDILTPLDWQPTMALIAYGTNDWATKLPEQTIADAKAFLAKFCAKYPGLPTAVIAPIWRANHLTRRTDDFSHEGMYEVLLELAKPYPQLRVIPGYPLFPKIRELMADANIHPNEIGYTIYANRLNAALLQYDW